MTKLKKHIIFGISLLAAISCAKRVNDVVFGANTSYKCAIQVFNPENDTVLVVSEMPGSRVFSFHTIEQNDTAFILRNICTALPKISILENIRDTVFKFKYVDESGQEIINPSLFFIVNDSIGCNSFDYQWILNSEKEIDSIYSLRIESSGGFEFSGNNLSKGLIIFQIKGHEDVYSGFNIEKFYRDYYIPATKSIVLNDTTTMNKSDILYSETSSIEYYFWSLIRLKRRDYEKKYGWIEKLK